MPAQIISQDDGSFVIEGATPELRGPYSDRADALRSFDRLIDEQAVRLAAIDPFARLNRKTTREAQP